MLMTEAGIHGFRSSSGYDSQRQDSSFELESQTHLCCKQQSVTLINKKNSTSVITFTVISAVETKVDICL